MSTFTRILALVGFLFCGLCWGQNGPTRTITPSPAGTGTTTWSKDTIYFLDGTIFVNPGQTLTIQAGTIVKGRLGVDTAASHLVIARGATLLAEGTVTEPIIFTAEADDVTDPNDMPFSENGLWGGVTLLGNSQLNTVPAEQAIEGIPTTESRAVYGGNDGNDSSGILKYVSIRYAGVDIGAGNEIAGLTLAGVGTATEIDYVECIFGNSDGIRILGGTPEIKHLICAFNEDDGIDWDIGYRGRGQYWFFVMDSSGANRGIEADGGTSPEDGTPFATPVLSNMTILGSGPAQFDRLATFRDNSGGELHNSIFYDWGQGIDIEILTGSAHSYAQFQAGNLSLNNNIFEDVAGNAGNDQVTVVAGNPNVPANDLANANAVVQSVFGSSGNSVQAALLNNTSYWPKGNLDPRPSSNSPAVSGAIQPSVVFFDPVQYRGAFDPNAAQIWAAGWTALAQDGFLESGIATDISTALPEQDFIVFPNPSVTGFRIQFAENVQQGQINITDLSGRIIFHQELEEVTEIGFDLKAPAGTYILHVNANGRSLPARLISRL